MAQISSVEQTRQILDMLSEKIDRWIEHPEQVRILDFSVHPDTINVTAFGDTTPSFLPISSTYKFEICVVE